MLAEVTRGHLHAQSILPLRIFFGVLLLGLVAIAIYFIQHRERFFSGRGGDRTTDSPAAGNLRMWMVVLVLIHLGILLILMMFEV